VTRAALLAFAVVAAACGKSGSDEPPSPRLEAYQQLRDRMCACTDRGCTEIVLAEYKALQDRIRSQPPGKNDDAILRLQVQMADCRSAIHAKSAPTTAPPATP
jgi:hypothetical protein